MDNKVWCLSSMAHFGRIAARALGWPLVIDGPTGVCDHVFMLGMYDAPHYEHSLAMTAGAAHRIIQWCGSDTMFLSRPDLLPEATHLASFDIYRDRVRTRGIPCETLYLPTYSQPGIMPVPDPPTIGAYLGGNPPAYGATIVAALAECLPTVKFKVMTYGPDDEEGLHRFIGESAVSVQPGNTNGGSTTREMMAAGRIALSTIPMPYVRLISPDNFPALLAEVRRALSETADPEQMAYWAHENADATFKERIEAMLDE